MESLVSSINKVRLLKSLKLLISYSITFVFIYVIYQQLNFQYLISHIKDHSNE